MAFDLARAKSLFLGASDLPSPGERAAYLDRECRGEPDLRARVEALLAAGDRAGPVPEPGPTGSLDLTRDGPLEATQMSPSETRPGSWVSDQDAGLATAGATGVGEQHGTLAEAPSVARTGGFVPGQVIGGRYTLLEVLGEGGMGTVYKAEQSRPVRRHVALKLIKLGMDSRSVLARFDAERQALAMMDHPNIARVFDGGATDANQPFFVMEFVDGVPITDYCDRHRLSVAARLELFVAVCQAVQHAHQKGIIHRDLKPSNVMVTEVDGRPTPKVIDFGVAKATEVSLTDQSLGDTGAIVGTPSYMSPEQADPSTQDIDTRTDIYALGVILYELLAGSPPLDASQFKRGALLEMLRMVREVDPSKPSTKVSTADALPCIAANRAIEPDRLKRALRGDLDWIVMKALEKDRTRRYETANGLGADILRHLASEPVLAAPPSRSYRLRKFVRKHRAGVIAASLVVLALVVGVAGTTWGLVEARRSAEAERLAKLDAQAKKRLAEENEKKALAAAEAEKKAKETVEDVLGFVEDKVFAAARPKGREGGLGYDVKLAEAIAAALPAIEKGFPGKPLTEARLRMTIGQSFLCLSKPDLAAAQYEAARSLCSRHLGPDHPKTLASMSGLANSLSALGRLPEALRLREETLALDKAKSGPDHPDTLRSMGRLANSYLDLGRHAEAVKLYEETLALQKAKLGPDHPDTLTTMSNLTRGYAVLGWYAKAARLYEEALALQKAKLGPDHPDTLGTMNNLAITYAYRGRHAEALALREEVLAKRKAKLGPDHVETLGSMCNLAASYLELGRLAEAVRLYEETLGLMRAKLPEGHPFTLNTMDGLASTYAALGRHAEALALHEEVLARRNATLGPDHQVTLITMSGLATRYAAMDRHAEALRLREQTLALMRAKLGPDDFHTLGAMCNLAISYADLGRHAEAARLYEETLGLMRAKLPEGHPFTLNTMGNLASTYAALGRHAEALALREEVLARRKAKLGAGHTDTLRSMGSLAESYLAAGRRAEAFSLLEAAAAGNAEASCMLAAARAWFGDAEAYAKARRRLLASADDRQDKTAWRLAALAGGLRPSADPAELGALLALGRKAVGLNKGQWDLLALGLAEYRNGRLDGETLLAAAKAGEDPRAAATASFYRAMGLFRQGKAAEARDLAARTAAGMDPPPPADEGKPVLLHEVGDLIVWLACKEAKALIGLDPPPAPTAADAK